MQNLIITTLLSSAYSPFVLPYLPDSNTDTIPERVVRAATIDGEVYLYSLGKTDGDRTFSLITEMTKEQFDLFDTVRNNYNEFFVSVPCGTYKGMISEVSADDKTAITFLVESKA